MPQGVQRKARHLLKGSLRCTCSSRDSAHELCAGVWHDASIMKHDLFMCVTWLMHICDMLYATHCSTLQHTQHTATHCNAPQQWLIHVCDMAHAYLWRDSIKCVPWLIHAHDMAHSHVCRGSFICETTYITHSYVRQHILRMRHTLGMSHV